jgi:hypothetical protein
MGRKGTGRRGTGLWRRRRRCIAGVLDLIDVMSQVMFCRAVGSGDVLRAGRDVSSRGLGLKRDGLRVRCD